MKRDRLQETRWQKFAERHDNSESPRTLWAWPKRYREDGKDWELTLTTMPTQWTLGCQVERDYGTSYFGTRGRHHIWATASLGPWQLVLTHSWLA